jgi:hypothetical protein
VNMDVTSDNDMSKETRELLSIVEDINQFERDGGSFSMNQYGEVNVYVPHSHYAYKPIVRRLANNREKVKEYLKILERINTIQ